MARRLAVDMKKTGIGILLCVAGITLIHQNRWVVGLALFLVGISLLMVRR